MPCNIDCTYQITPTDPEVAFIRVRDASMAAFSLARYGMLKKSFRFISVDAITLEIIKKIVKKLLKPFSCKKID
jgi:hypothetical protein